jgi:hypothetical protein
VQALVRSLGTGGSADSRRITHARERIHDALDIVWEDLQPFRRDNQFLLPAPDEEPTIPPNFSDVTGMKPTPFKCLRGLRFGLEVAAGDVFPTHEDFAV